MSIKNNRIGRSGMVVLCAALAAMPGIAAAVAGDANAASTIVPLNTSPLYADNGISYHACNVVNVTQSTQNVKIDLLNGAGTVVATSGAAPVAVGAGAVYEVSGGGFSGFARCRFSNVNGDNVRANISVFRWTGTYYETLSTSEAR